MIRFSGSVRVRVKFSGSGRVEPANTNRLAPLSFCRYNEALKICHLYHCLVESKLRQIDWSSYKGRNLWRQWRLLVVETSSMESLGSACRSSYGGLQSGSWENCLYLIWNL